MRVSLGVLLLKMKSNAEWTAFLDDYPEMALKPSRDDSIIFKGSFKFSAQSKGGPHITDSYDLKIEFPFSFPKELPKVWELNNKIPEGDSFHVNPDKTLCLGSPIRLLHKVNKSPTMTGFAENCLVPFLYAVSRKLKDGGDFYMGELEHGEPGIIDDYKDIFSLNDKDQVRRLLNLLRLKKRIANKRECPCNCGKRLGKCKLRFKVNNTRKMASRSWFQKHSSQPGSAI